jgi:site-specific DNA-methyltransferase (adenine-specific)
MKLLLGDCLDKLKELEDNSVDSIVTDPPYGLSAAPNSGKSSKGGFMGKQWDYDVPSVEIWEECLRVLKPGGHLLAFAGSRTYHRMAVRIEDAGFEIRDMISWLYGSGFPKSMDISKQFDKRAGVEREVVGKRTDAFGDVTESETGDGRNLWGKASTTEVDVYSTEAVTDLAKEWSGWGTALKPAHEPVVMARKPLSEGTVVDNVQKWRTGGINIDESRVGNEPLEYRTTSYKEGNGRFAGQGQENITTGHKTVEGRFPANIIIDEEVGKLLDEQSGISKSTGGKGEKSKGSLGDMVYGKYKNETHAANAGGLGDIGGASRFFYCPKVSKSERNEGLGAFPDLQGNVVANSSGRPYKLYCQTCGKRQGICKCEPSNFGYENPNTTKNIHPTVKPVDLMLYLIRLVTPKGGTTLDPFMGSGSTGKAAVRGGFGFIGIEREGEYYEIAEARINYEADKPKVVKNTTGKKVEVSKETEQTLNTFFE